jgi:hypothetical protein
MGRLAPVTIARRGRPPVSVRPPRPIRLTADQRRHLGVLLEQVDDGLLTVQRLAEPGVRELGVRRRDVADLPDAFMQEAPAAIAEVRTKIARLADLLGLEEVGVSRRQQARARLLSMVVHLEDAGSRGLRGYGAVDPSVREHMDPVIEEIRLAVLATWRLLIDHADGERTAP